MEDGLQHHKPGRQSVISSANFRLDARSPPDDGACLCSRRVCTSRLEMRRSQRWHIVFAARSIACISSQLSSKYDRVEPSRHIGSSGRHVPAPSGTSAHQAFSALMPDLPIHLPARGELGAIQHSRMPAASDRSNRLLVQPAAGRGRGRGRRRRRRGTCESVATGSDQTGRARWSIRQQTPRSAHSEV